MSGFYRHMFIDTAHPYRIKASELSTLCRATWDLYNENGENIPDDMTLVCGEGSTLPHIVATLDTDTDAAYLVPLEDNATLLLAGRETLQSIDISDRAHPAKRSTLNDLSYIENVAYAAAYDIALLGKDDEGKVVDLSDPDRLVSLGDIDASYTKFFVSQDGKRLYAEDVYGEIHTADIDEETKIPFVAPDALQIASLYAISIDGDEGYGYDWDEKAMEIYTLNETDDIWSEDEEGTYRGPNYLGGVVLGFEDIQRIVPSADGTKVGVVGDDDTIALVDVADTGAPTLLTEIDVDGWVEDIRFSPDGRRLYVVTDSPKVLIYDLSDPAHPSPTNTVTLPDDESWSYALAISADGHTLFVGSEYHLYILDTGV